MQKRRHFLRHQSRNWTPNVEREREEREISGEGSDRRCDTGSGIEFGSGGACGPAQLRLFLSHFYNSKMIK